MNKHSLVARLSLLLVSLFSSIDIGRASWISVKDKEEASIAISSDPGRAVCYIGDTYYTSLDAALDVASNNSIDDTIYVIPNLGTAVSITKNHKINSGDSLVLPYEDSGTLIACGVNIETGKAVTADAMIHGDGSVIFADQSATSVSNYRQTKVVLDSSVQLTVNGSLLIGGKLGRPAQGVSGGTAGSYCEMTLSQNAKIICGYGGNIECDGYIKRAAKSNGSSLQVKEGGTLISPLVIYDYKGGTLTTTIINDGIISPFYVFDFPNIQVKTEVAFDGYWISKTCLYIDTLKSYIQVDNLYFIAPSNSSKKSILIQKSGNITVDYVPADSKNVYTSSGVDGTKTNIAISGEVDIGSITSTNSNITIDSSTFYLPISYRLKMLIKEDSVLNSPSKVKFMNGSSVTIEKGATVNVTAPLAIYGSDFADNGSGIPIPYPSITENNEVVGASFINNGTINVRGEGAIGGFIATEADANDATINYEATSNSTSSPEIKENTYEISFKNYVTYTSGSLINKAASAFSEGTIVTGSYPSAVSNGSYGWYSPFYIDVIDKSSKSETTGGSIQVKAVIDSDYLSAASYSWSVTDTDGKAITGISISGSDGIATVTNTTIDEATVIVLLTVGDSDSGEYYAMKKVSVPKMKVEIKIKQIKVTVSNIQTSENGTVSFGTSAATTAIYTNPDKTQDYTWGLTIAIITEDDKEYDGNDIEFNWLSSTGDNKLKIVTDNGTYTKKGEYSTYSKIFSITRIYTSPGSTGGFVFKLKIKRTGGECWPSGTTYQQFSFKAKTKK